MTINLKDLTNEQLVKLYQETKDERYFNQLYKTNEGLIKSIIYKYNQGNIVNMTYDDIESQANIGFLKAVNGFDESKNVKFSTLATTVMKREIHRINVDNSRKKRYCPYEIVPIHSKPKTESHTYDEMISYDASVFTEVEYLDLDRNEVYNRLTNILSPTQVKVLELLNQGYNQKEIAKITNKTHQNVSLRVKAIRDACVKVGFR